VYAGPSLKVLDDVYAGPLLKVLDDVYVGPSLKVPGGMCVIDEVSR
jgi:hypothetical protein